MSYMPTSRMKKLYFFFVLLLSSIPVVAMEQIVFYPDVPSVSKTQGIPVVLSDSIDTLVSLDETLNIALPNGRVTTGKPRSTFVGSGLRIDERTVQGRTMVIPFDDHTGSLQLTWEGTKLVSMLMNDGQSESFFRADIENLHGTLMSLDPHEIQCISFPEVNGSTDDIASINEFHINELTPDLLTLQTLQSKPGATNVIFIDYWGGTLSDTAWNDNFNGGNLINYSPYSFDGNTSTFSTDDRYRMWLGWREAAEDYAEFDVNVTTDISVFNATANTNKIRNIATTTNYFFPGAGGVAYIGVFGNTSSYYQTSWTWNSGNSSLGMTISHEAGHQMGLSHDGTFTSSYYRGHGDWGPIMGAPFGKKYVQFSKGEYPSANQYQDDLSIVYGKLGIHPDEAGDSNLNARMLASGGETVEGVITSPGLSSDEDIFSFTLTGQQTVSLSIKPLIVYEDANENYGTNLSMRIVLSDNIGSVISETNPSFSPNTNTLVYYGTPGPGTYYAAIKSESANNNWVTGFGPYGNGGTYQLTFESSGGNNTFEDVPDNHWAFSEIETFYESGITSGCNTTPLKFCPEESVSRGQMAVLLLRSIYGSSYSPPPANGAVFVDIPANYWAAGWIEQLAAEGITSGCGAGNYCPDSPVTREQMAVFILRALYGANYNPPMANGVFEDVPLNNWAVNWVESLYNSGITSGCNASPMKYCPLNQVTRAQMAVFLVRAFFTPSDSTPSDSEDLSLSKPEKM